MGRKIGAQVQRQAVTVVLLAVAAVIGGTVAIMLLTPFDLDDVLFESQLEERTGIAPCNVGNWRCRLCHERSSLTGEAAGFRREPETLANPLTLLIYSDHKHGHARSPGRKSIAV